MAILLPKYETSLFPDPVISLVWDTPRKKDVLFYFIVYPDMLSSHLCSF